LPILSLFVFLEYS